MALARLRERRHLGLSVLPQASPAYLYKEHPLGDMPSTPPDSLAELERVAVLGHDAGSTVYKARHRRTGAMLAVKGLRGGDDAALHEAEMHLRVVATAPDHPHVARLLCVFPGGDHHQLLCLVFEHAPAGSLADELRRRCGRLDERAIAGVAKCVLRGLCHLHRLGDVKPSNLLVVAGPYGGEVVRIADFGASRLVCDKSTAHSTCTTFAAGTCAYMSPERLDPEGFGVVPGCDFAGDVRALGVVLLELDMPRGQVPASGAGERPD
ncbi:hypothetical protein PR202_ga02374 [Eleusine coracana subsp. coracana]|uniref:mitogen-activated protein kinase kinase n=1 Tax=Eleusine coracana subsp. coracana TaxID=191504 RepID=A0AAV5BLI7_ELECO|nr:hypothetical protein QOZ80_2AG0141750 [Eleusine coracana subsp. coracana]GJM86508.1 hypothetical protein PR202_ga02374 [Eleusine coracana subsp. coracana]